MNSIAENSAIALCRNSEQNSNRIGDLVVPCCGTVTEFFSELPAYAAPTPVLLQWNSCARTEELLEQPARGVPSSLLLGRSREESLVACSVGISPSRLLDDNERKTAEHFKIKSSRSSSKSTRLSAVLRRVRALTSPS